MPSCSAARRVWPSTASTASCRARRGSCRKAGGSISHCGGSRCQRQGTVIRLSHFRPRLLIADRRDPGDPRSARLFDNGDAPDIGNLERLPHHLRARGLCHLKPRVNVINGKIGHPAFRHALELRIRSAGKYLQRVYRPFSPPNRCRSASTSRRTSSRSRNRRISSPARRRVSSTRSNRSCHATILSFSLFADPDLNATWKSAPITPLRTAGGRLRYFPPFDRSTITTTHDSEASHRPRARLRRRARGCRRRLLSAWLAHRARAAAWYGDEQEFLRLRGS